MASQNHNQFKAGLFIVASFALAAAIFFGITGSNLLDGPYKTYRVNFDLTEDVGGLAVGSEVRIGGVTIGKVSKIDVVAVNEQTGGFVTQAVFSAPERYQIKTDAIVAVQAPLTGLPNLNITNMGMKALASETDILDGQPAGLALALEQVAGVGREAQQLLTDIRPRVNNLLDDVRPRANQTLDQFKATAASAQSTIELAREKINPAYEKYAAVADGARGAVVALDEILGGGKGDLRQTIADLASAMASVREKLPGILDRATGLLDDARGALAKTGTILEDVQTTAANTRDLTGNAKGILAANRTRIDDIVKSVKLTGDNLSAASGEIRRSPWRLLYTPSEGEVANQNLYDATRQLAEASRKLQDSATALRDLMNDPSADKDAVGPMIEALNRDFASYQKVEGELWNRVKK